MASAAPTPSEVYERVRERVGGSSDFELALRLTQMGVPILEKTLARMKRGEGTNFQTTVALLQVAGWLNRSQDQADARSQREIAERLAQHLEQVLGEIREAL